MYDSTIVDELLLFFSCEVLFINFMWMEVSPPFRFAIPGDDLLLLIGKLANQGEFFFEVVRLLSG